MERRGYLTLRISFPQDTAKLLLRKTDGIRKWAQVLQESISSAKSRKIKTTEEFWTRRQNTDLFETASCISETASTTILPNHLSRGRHLETASAVGRKSYNNLKTTHYGLIDWPSSPKAEKSKSKLIKKSSSRCQRGPNYEECGIDIRDVETNRRSKGANKVLNRCFKSP